MIPKTKYIINIFRVIWILFILNNELIVFLSSARQCANSKSLISPNPSQFMLVADPQMTDDKSYDRHWLILWITEFYSALYMKRNYKYLLNTLEPKEIFFMGDLMDNGREWDDNKYKAEVERFHTIFKSTQKKHYMVGNHDIGFGNGARLELRNRFEEYFGNTSYILEADGYAIVVLDTVSLSSDDQKLKNSVLSILDGELPAMPRILMTHVPLYRTADVSCGPNRQKLNTIIPDAAGYQYQNLISKELSDYILNTVQPIAVFSGDDHDYCKVEHTYGKNSTVAEITVPTFSMSQGLRSPGVMFLNLQPSSITTELCWLPDQVNLFIQYGYLLFLTITALIVFHIWQFISTKKRGYSHLAKEEMGITTTNTQQHPRIMFAKRSCFSFLNSIKDIALVGITTYVVCILVF